MVNAARTLIGHRMRRLTTEIPRMKGREHLGLVGPLRLG